MAAKEWLLSMLGKSQFKNWELTNEPISNHKNILQVLSKLADKRALCSVKLEHATDAVRGFVTKLDKTDYLLTVDLHDIKNMPKRGSQLTVFSQLNGADTHFESAISQINENQVHIEVPNSIYHVTRRQTERVILTPVGTAKLAVAHPSGHLEGTLFDLSTGGIGGVVKASVAVTKGEEYTCFLEFPDKSRMMTRMSVVHVSHDPKPGYIRLGLEFCSLSADDEKTLTKHID